MPPAGTVPEEAIQLAAKEPKQCDESQPAESLWGWKLTSGGTGAREPHRGKQGCSYEGRDKDHGPRCCQDKGMSGEAERKRHDRKLSS